METDCMYVDELLLPLLLLLLLVLLLLLLIVIIIRRIKILKKIYKYNNYKKNNNNINNNNYGIYMALNLIHEKTIRNAHAHTITRTTKHQLVTHTQTTMGMPNRILPFVWPIRNSCTHKTPLHILSGFVVVICV